MSSIVEEIKSKLSIVDVVSSYLKLEKAGSNFKARCPFHNEKTASFFISPSPETYHCFGCNRGGDMVSFIEEIEGLDFRGALKILADRAGVRLTSAESSVDKERDKLFQVLNEAALFYAEQLSKNQKAKKYILDRGISEKMIKEFEIGYAPNEWRALSQFLAQKGFLPDVVLSAGLSIKSEKARSAYSGLPDAQSAVRGFYDRFRGRIMFPIADSSGRIVGFSGRILPWEEGGDLPARGLPVRPPARNARAGSTQTGAQAGESAQAKYVNSPETAVFHKSRVLYGFDKAKQSIRKHNQAVLVEGQMDLVLSHQAGVTNTVAASGTALTRDHLVSIKRLADVLIIAFDADSAGLAASKKGVDLALAEGFDVRVPEIPEGMDPADVAKNDPEDWKQRIANAKHIIDFYLRALSGKGYDMREFRRKTSELVLPYIAKLRNTIDQAHFVAETARALHITEEPIWDELKKMSQSNKGDVTDGVLEEKEITQPVDLNSRKEKIERKIQGIIFWQEEVAQPVLNIDEIKKKYTSVAGETSAAMLHDMTSEKKKDLIFEAEVYYQSAKNLSEDVDLLLANLEAEALKEELIRTMSELKGAEARGDTVRIGEILGRCQEISKKLSEIKKK